MKKSSILSIFPYGGLGQIGANMIYVKGQKDNFLIDAGIQFPYEDSFNVNYLIPNYDDLNDVENLLITHGHEDHIGGIIHVLDKFPRIKIWAPPLAEALIKAKLEHFGKNADIRVYSSFEPINLRDLTITPVNFNHSIPDTFGLLIKPNDRPVSLLYISDFKVDLTMFHESLIDFDKLKALTSDDQVKICFADSTNINSSMEKTPSESDVEKNIDQIFDQYKKRTFITLFPSNLHRIKSIVELAQKHGRRVGIIGRSMSQYIKIAIRLGIIKSSSNIEHEVDGIKNCDDSNIIFLLSGCQGDYKGAFSRLVSGQDKKLTFKDSDVFVYSAKPIPGNELRITYLMNKLWDSGVTVIDSSDYIVHASGHAGREDLKILYNNFSPTHIVPIHGETSFLYKHCKFINANYPKITPILLTNGDHLSIDHNLKIEKDIAEPKDMKLIHGNNIEINKAAIIERRKIAQSGILFISLKVDHKEINVKITVQGLSPYIDENKILNLKKEIEHSIRKNNSQDSSYRSEQIKILTRNYFAKGLGYKPIVCIHDL